MEDPSLREKTAKFLNRRTSEIVEVMNSNLLKNKEIKDKCDKNLTDLKEFRIQINKNLKSLEAFDLIKNLPKDEMGNKNKIGYSDLNFEYGSEVQTILSYYDLVKNFHLKDYEEDVDLLKIKLDSFEKYVANSNTSSSNSSKLKDLIKTKKLLKNELKKLQKINVSNVFETEKKNKLYQNLSERIKAKLLNLSEKIEKTQKPIKEIKEILTEAENKRDFFSKFLMEWTQNDTSKLDFQLFEELVPVPIPTLFSPEKVNYDVLEIQKNLSTEIDSLRELMGLLQNQVNHMSFEKNAFCSLDEKVLKSFKENIPEKHKKLLIDLYLCDAQLEFFGLEKEEFQKYQQDLMNEIKEKEKDEQQRNADINKLNEKIMNSQNQNSLDVSSLNDKILVRKYMLNEYLRGSLGKLYEKIQDYSNLIYDNNVELEQTLKSNNFVQLFKKLKIDFDEAQCKLLLKDKEVFKA